MPDRPPGSKQRHPYCYRLSCVWGVQLEPATTLGRVASSLAASRAPRARDADGAADIEALRAQLRDNEHSRDAVRSPSPAPASIVPRPQNRSPRPTRAFLLIAPGPECIAAAGSRNVCVV